MQINPQEIKNILVVRNDRFGEFLLNIPALRALRETFKGAKIILVVDPHVRELAEAIPFVDEVVEGGQKNHSLSDKVKLIGNLRKKSIDIAVLLNPSKEFNIITFFAGIPIRAGYARKCGFFLNLKIKDNKHTGEKHEVEYNLELVRLVGADTHDFSLSLKIDDSIISGLGDYLKCKSYSTIVAIHPWTSDPVKQWPLENFRELAIKLLGYHKLKVVIVGGNEEADKSREIFAALGPGVLNLTGKTNLLQLAAILKKSKLLISGDSGPVHLACSVGTLVLALFRNDIPGKTSKRWGPWGAGHAVIEKRSLSDINVDEVFYKAKEMMER